MVCAASTAFRRGGEMLNLWRFIAGVGLVVQLVPIDTCIFELIPGAARGRAFSFNSIYWSSARRTPEHQIIRH